MDSLTGIPGRNFPQAAMSPLVPEPDGGSATLEGLVSGGLPGGDATGEIQDLLELQAVHLPTGLGPCPLYPSDAADDLTP